MISKFRERCIRFNAINKRFELLGYHSCGIGNDFKREVPIYHKWDSAKNWFTPDWDRIDLRTFDEAERWLDSHMTA